MKTILILIFVVLTLSGCKALTGVGSWEEFKEFHGFTDPAKEDQEKQMRKLWQIQFAPNLVDETPRE